MGLIPKYLLILAVVICLRLYGSDAILCYQCGDTTGDKPLATCYHNTKVLLAERHLHEKGEPLRNLYKLKNCSHYRDNRGEFVYQYCKTETISAHGVTAAFIRDCTDGKTFGLDVTKLLQVKTDNQSTCGFSDLHKANICVSVCTTDFCNGPLSAAPAIVTSVFLLCAAVFMGHFGKQYIC